MKSINRLVSLGVLFSLVLSGLISSAVPVSAQDSGPQFIPGEVVVGFAAGQTLQQYKAQASALAGDVGAQVAKQMGSLALLSFAEDADVTALANQVATMQGVAFAEPNYVYRIPEETDIAGNRPVAVNSIKRRTGEKSSDTTDIPISALKAMRSVKSGRIMATYPNDYNLWVNWGWSYINSDVVWQNTTPSAAVCVLDTGVDYMHPDLGLNTIKGYDFVNDDLYPMDDNGHGTHVAGVIAAVRNNRQGIAGVSSGKVVAVKVLNAEGRGSNYNIAAGINYCASRTDVRVLNMSLGGGYSNAIYWAVDYAVNTKNKLLVAAAGNDGGDIRNYPAGFSDSWEFQNKVLSVGAIDDWGGCRAPYSNYGSWVSVVAPGTDIYSTMPWDKPFYKEYDGYNRGYDYMSGTSMATPFVSAAAARRWGYKPLHYNYDIGSAVKNNGWGIWADDSCWPSSMNGVNQVDVAMLMDRGALWGYIYNATTNTPMVNAQLMAYKNGVLQGSAFASSWSGYASVINLPVGDYTPKVNMAGVTAGAQPAFWHESSPTVWGGSWSWAGRAAIPNKGGNFDVVTGWNDSYYDLDVDVWLPRDPNPQDPTQPSSFVVGPQGDDFGWREGQTRGTLMGFPFAIQNNDAGNYTAPPPLQSITIKKRTAHAPLTANALLPYYPGTYYIGITDFGQVDPSWNSYLYWAEPYVYIWKDGVIKAAARTYNCNAPWWFPFRFTSGLGGAVTFIWEGDCGDTYYGDPYSDPYFYNNPNFWQGSGNYWIKP